jgi:hypothetical protein
VEECQPLGTGASLDNYNHSDYDDDGKPVVTASIKSIIFTSIPVDYVIFSVGRCRLTR